MAESKLQIGDLVMDPTGGFYVLLEETKVNNWLIFSLRTEKYIRLPTPWIIDDKSQMEHIYGSR